MAVRRLMHLNVVCSDFDRSLAFYTDVVGATVVLSFDSGDREDDFLGAMGIAGGSEHRGAMLCLGDETRGPYIDLLEWKVPGDPEGRGARDVGVPRIAIQVEDVDESWAEVKEKGGTPMGAPVTIQTGPYHVRAFTFPDPDGFLIEFCQFVKPA